MTIWPSAIVWGMPVITALQVHLAALPDTSRRPPESSVTIPIERVVDGTAGVRDAGDPQLVSFAGSITLRARDPRPYDIAELGADFAFPGRTGTGEVLWFSAPQWSLSDSLAVRPPRVRASFAAEHPGALRGCPPHVAGYAPRYLRQTAEYGIGIGIWESVSGEGDTLIAIFPSIRECAETPGQRPPYRILLAGPVRWRLAALHMNIDYPPSLLVMSHAQVGEPITFAIYNLRVNAARFSANPRPSRRQRGR
jgi:hypothetical protein